MTKQSMKLTSLQTLSISQFCFSCVANATSEYLDPKTRMTILFSFSILHQYADVAAVVNGAHAQPGANVNLVDTSYGECGPPCKAEKS